MFNVPKRLTTDELLAFGQLKGIFYEESSFEQIGEGLKEIINGQNWLPRNVTSQLLHYYRNVISTHTAPATVDLTIRELQVLRCLQAGASNKSNGRRVIRERIHYQVVKTGCLAMSPVNFSIIIVTSLVPTPLLPPSI